MTCSGQWSAGGRDNSRLYTLGGPILIVNLIQSRILREENLHAGSLDEASLLVCLWVVVLITLSDIGRSACDGQHHSQDRGSGTVLSTEKVLSTSKHACIHFSLLLIVDATS